MQPWKRFGYPVFIRIDFDDFTALFTPKFLFWLKGYIKQSRQCFAGYLSTSYFVKIASLLVVFSPLLNVWISWWNIVSCLIILLQIANANLFVMHAMVISQFKILLRHLYVARRFRFITEEMHHIPLQQNFIPFLGQSYPYQKPISYI